MSSDARKGRAAAPAPSGGRGVFLVVAGPDGTGKSTVVTHLVDEVLTGRVQVLHHRPHLLGQRTRHQGAVTEPHRQQPYPRGFSVAKLLFLYLDYLVGWCVKVRPWLLDGGHVVVERGWWDLLIDPRRYRLRQAPRLVAALGRFLPRPDVTLVLGGDAATIASRTSELSVEETERQLRVWESLPTTRLRMRQIDATQPLSDMSSSVRRAVVSAADDDLLTDHMPRTARVAVARGRKSGRHNALILDGRTGAALAFAKIALLGRPSRRELLAAIHGRGRSGEIIRRYAEGAQVPVEDAERLIPDYLERTLETIDRTAPDGLRGVRARESLLRALRAEARGARSRGPSSMSHRVEPR